MTAASVRLELVYDIAVRAYTWAPTRRWWTWNDRDGIVALDLTRRRDADYDAQADER